MSEHAHKTVTLTEPGVAGRWEVERLEDGRLLLSPVGPNVAELEAEFGAAVSGEEFERRWGHLPRDSEG